MPLSFFYALIFLLRPMNTKLPKILYHASAFAHSVLKPGFQRSHQLMHWDVSESNTFLYATTEKHAAIDQGIAGAFEKRYGLKRFQITDQSISIHTEEQHVVAADVLRLEVYLYTISPPLPDNGWLHNHNEHNGLKTEWKTNQTVTYTKREKVGLRQALLGRSIQITYEPTVRERVAMELQDHPTWTRW